MYHTALYPCGCYYHLDAETHYLPQVKLQSHTTILRTTSETILEQTFTNATKSLIKECIYTFPLYDGISIVSFDCQIGSRRLQSVVKEKREAKATYDRAVASGQTAGLLEQLSQASDTFSTSLGNIPSGGEILVRLNYIGELKHDGGMDAIRWTLPASVAPRYGDLPHAVTQLIGIEGKSEISITVDVDVGPTSLIESLQSPSHPIAVTLGKTSKSSNGAPVMYKASASLALASAQLDRDFILVVSNKDNGTPTAFLETHPDIPGQRALIVDLVPKFSLTASKPEIVFVADRSGSMESQIPTLISAMKVFIRSLPTGVKFNICSFGTHHSFLWPKSKAYDQESLTEAETHIKTFQADYGGTETQAALRSAIENRFGDIDCEILLLTDGDMWRQQELFNYLNDVVDNHIRVFTLGIGGGVSSALIEGVARAGKGFAQMISDGEKLDKKVVRMLKGALSPHIFDFTMEVQYQNLPNEAGDMGWELVEKITDCLKITTTEKGHLPTDQKPISLFDQTLKDDEEDPGPAQDQDPFAHLPLVQAPKLLQAPNDIPPLFPFTRTTAYILMSPGTTQKDPTCVTLRGTSPQGPLELEIEIHKLPTGGRKIHQLAAKKAMQELEEGRGWISSAMTGDGILLKDRHPSCFDEMVRREGVRLGLEFQVAGKWCSFVAVSGEGESNDAEQSLPTLPPPVEHVSDPPPYMASYSSSMGLSPSPGNSRSGTVELFSVPPETTRSGNIDPYSSLILPKAAKSRKARKVSGAPPKPAIASYFASHRFSTFSRARASPEARLDPLEPPTRTGNEKVHAIISAQAFDGKWAVSDDLLGSMGLSGKISKSTDEKTMTMLVIAFLEEKMFSEKDVWELVVEKARDWLQNLGLGREQLMRMEDEARRLVIRECK